MKRTTGVQLENTCYETLHPIDIKTAIRYFGVTELLDNIGVSAIKSYLMNIRKDNACEAEVVKQAIADYI